MELRNDPTASARSERQLVTPGAANENGAVDVTVVCATQNVALSIEDLVKRIDVLMTWEGRTWHLLVVDDSDDDTPARLKRLADEGYPVCILHRRSSERIGGYSGALVEGFAVAQGKTIVVIGADLREPTEVLRRLLDVVDGDTGSADIAIASRFTVGADVVATDGWIRERISRVAAVLCSTLFSEARHVADPSSGCFAFRREVIDHVVFKPERFRVLIEILVRGSWERCVEIPTHHVGQMLGSRTVDPRNIALYLSRLIRLWLETRVDPGRFADERAVRESALQAAVPWADATDVRPLPGTSVLIVASEVPPIRSGVARTVGRVGVELTMRGMDVAYMSGSDHWRLGIGEVRLSALGAVFFLRRRMRTVDVVILHGPMPTVSEVVLAGFALWPGNRRPRLVYVHHFDVDFCFLGVPSILYNLVHHSLARSADRVIVTSHSYGAVLSRGVGSEVTVIPWGVDPPSRPALLSTYDGNRPLRILFVGQQRRYKGISNLILAVVGQPELELTVAGGGPLLDEHVELVSRLDATNVCVLGPVAEDELERLFAEHDVIALPSITRLEAFGMVLLEGMRAGCVPVAADLPGVRDLVGQHGILVAPRRIATLRDALIQLAMRPEEVRARSSAARERSAQFTWDRTGDRYASVVAEALCDRP